MNRQLRKMQGVTLEDAQEILYNVFDDGTRYPQQLEYYAFPYLFGNTAGPLKRSNNTMAGQAMTTFTIEAWTDGRHSVLFCQGLVVDIRCDVDGFDPLKVRL